MFKTTSLLFIFAFIANLYPQNYHPIFEELVYNIRDPQTGRKEFRRNIEKIGEYLALEISKELSTKSVTIQTCLGQATHNLIHEDIVIITILRAGIPLFDGMMKVFPNAQSGFFAMARDEETAESTVFYQALPPLEGKTVIIADVMLATAGSALNAIMEIEKQNPKKIIFAGAIGATYGKEKILEHNPNISIYLAALDPTLNEKAYIVPGLGDAGDRSYGTK